MSVDKIEHDEHGEVTGFYVHSEFDEDSPNDVADLWGELLGDIWDDILRFPSSKGRRGWHFTFYSPT